jgi:hypothetical protein
LFQDWQRTQTQSSVTAPRGPRLRMDVRFCEGRNHRREAQLRAADAGECGCARSSEARVRRTAFPLDKDLHGRRQTGNYPETGFWEMGRIQSRAFPAWLPAKNTKAPILSGPSGIESELGNLTNGQTNPEGRARLTRRLIMDLVLIVIFEAEYAPRPFVHHA